MVIDLKENFTMENYMVGGKCIIIMDFQKKVFGIMEIKLKINKLK
jgi:hypothetical protein